MRLRRLCERKAGGKLNVAPEVHEAWVSGNREELALALTHALKLHGFADSKKIRNQVRVRHSDFAVCLAGRFSMHIIY